MNDKRSDRWGRLLYNLSNEEGADWKTLAPDERIHWCNVSDHFRKSLIPDGHVVVPQDRLSRLVAAASKLRRFSRSVIDYGGHVPESEALTDDDLAIA